MTGRTSQTNQYGWVLRTQICSQSCQKGFNVEWHFFCNRQKIKILTEKSKVYKITSCSISVESYTKIMDISFSPPHHHFFFILTFNVAFFLLTKCPLGPHLESPRKSAGTSE